MPVVSLRIPQIGEGLQEARLVAFLKQPGDKVRRDEPIYQMETDKAVMDVESPYEGTLVAWLGEPDQVLAIGADVATMEVAGEVEDAPAGHGPPTATPVVAVAEPARSSESGNRLRNVPPRTRAYAKEKGLSDDDLAALAAVHDKVLPETIDAHLAGKTSAPSAPLRGYAEVPLTTQQRVLASRLQRGSQLVVPGTETVVMKWDAIERAREAVKKSGDGFQPSAFTMFAFAVARALADHPAFRSTLVGEGTLRTYLHAHLGIAVALPGDELVLAVIEDADDLDWRSFAQRARDRIELARSGKDQVNEAVTISLTNMQRYGLRDAVPVVVPPAVATLFIGEVYWGLPDVSEQPIPQRMVNLTLTFDHRVINGVGAANFLLNVRQNVESIESLLP
ncbi:MAG: 2-oxo acid dehydrogenase subunit E2 [Fimbriimonadaceae bacterium]|nr:2-oxo acid dehydrogenase subunit E2 [Fimbriimonadaceae bacterium]